MNEKSTNYVKVTVVRLPATDEWVVRLWDANGRRLVKADYYTDDKQDALDTAKVLESKIVKPAPTPTPTLPPPPVRRYEYWVQELRGGKLGAGNEVWRDNIGLGNRSKAEAIVYYKQVWVIGLGHEDGPATRLVERRIDETVISS
jgi:hypothetical protein